MSAPINQCGACGEDFSSLENFARHRVGKHEYDFSPGHPDGRRCLSVIEMQEMGFLLDKRGRWTDPVHNAKVVRTFSGQTSPTQRPSGRSRDVQTPQKRSGPPVHVG